MITVMSLPIWKWTTNLEPSKYIVKVEHFVSF